MRWKYNSVKRKWERYSDELVQENNQLGTGVNGDHSIVYCDPMLMDKINLIRLLIRKKFDCVMIIDGDERTGKSILGMTCGWILSNCTLTPDCFASGRRDIVEKIRKMPPSTEDHISVLIADESSLAFSSKDAMQKELKSLVKIMDVVGQKGIVFILILPSFFDLVKPIAVRRSRLLLHTYTDDQYNRGRYAYFGEKEKKALYFEGKKNYGSYRGVTPRFKGRFTDFKLPWYEEYLKIKNKSLDEALDEGTDVPLKDQSEILNKLLFEFKKNAPEVPNLTIAKGFGLSKSEFYRRIGAYRGVFSPESAPIINTTLRKLKKNNTNKEETKQ